MRKKWTAKEDVSETELNSREKKKWQIALRRYIIEQVPSRQYAPFFGADIKTFREWIEMQFDSTLLWTNFGTSWQFEHIVPASFFSFSDPEDMKLCWNFTNIKVSASNIAGPDLVSARYYFHSLFQETQYDICLKLLEKLKSLEVVELNPYLTFFKSNASVVKSLLNFNEEDFERINKGEFLKDIMLEKEILTKFGS